MGMYCVITSDEVLFKTIAKNIGSSENENTVFRIDNIDEAVDYMNTELPEMIFINFSDTGFDSFTLLDLMMKDPWLLHSGVIALTNNAQDTKRVEETQGANIIVVIDTKQIECSLPKAMSIIQKNRRILFQRGLGVDIVENISGSFKLKNDPLEVQCYANLICNFLFNTKKINCKGKFGLQMALTEMLFNGIEHGNCEISFDEKSQWLERGKTIEKLICWRNRVPEIKKRRVTFEYTLNPTKAYFSIVDEGKGFDWRKVKEVKKPESMLELHGRGIFLTRKVTNNLTYNDKGNALTFEFVYNPEEADLRPGLFTNIKPRKIHEGEIIFQQGEPSNFLYYIANGNYDIIVNEKIVSSLNPDDIFMGEMSFLLNNHRSATVRARTDGHLIEISKKEFVKSIKKKPH
ncbi:MAG: hypothetical protein D3924_06560, partial [Candidatus Electrothrix sp. AR4]|nr:hypothetical protein [Candidatus Electrothrix sp. AR4]